MSRQFEISYSFGYVYDKSKLIAMYPVGSNVISEDEYEMEVEVAFLEDGINAAFKEEDIKFANDTMKPLEMFLMKPNNIIPFVDTIKDFDTKEELTKLITEFDKEYELKNEYIQKGYEIKDYYDVFKNVTKYIPNENLDNLNILKIESEKFDMNKFLNDIKENLDEVTEANPIFMEKSELTPRLFIKSKSANSTKCFYIPFATYGSSYDDGIVCANKERIEDIDSDMGDLEITVTKDAGYIIENINNILTFKISNFNSKTENNNQITQVVDYGGIIKPMMIEFLNSYIKN
ncbi:hypothetical protein [Romboutsia sp. 1001713B170207_170306_H8]|uniref:hypothetical protein n=1 Tax=Romboutsia sp. 1001713B170207_170306_H8 TaxID=2787112 RepID=UPI000822EB1E|nr:hypothetical protein [Romboutsia sp. 1001713B170207_170306_H8]SCH92370.1 Uncharacterised protein [uncultured Clostridium sp.]